LSDSAWMTSVSDGFAVAVTRDSLAALPSIASVGTHAAAADTNANASVTSLCERFGVAVTQERLAALPSIASARGVEAAGTGTKADETALDEDIPPDTTEARLTARVRDDDARHWHLQEPQRPWTLCLWLLTLVRSIEEQ
jgi:hypothetical protein